MTMKMSPEAVSIHRKLKAKGVPARTAAKMALRASRKSTSLSNPTEIETDLAYVGFGKLAAKLKAEGASDPDALAASIGRRKYGAKKFAKAAAKSTPLGKAKK